jgi:hypothetical protein
MKETTEFNLQKNQNKKQKNKILKQNENSSDMDEICYELCFNEHM